MNYKMHITLSFDCVNALKHQKLQNACAWAVIVSGNRSAS